MFKLLALLVKREVGLALVTSSRIVNPLAFFVITVALFPFALGDEAALLARLGGGIVWVAALLAAMISFAAVFEEDHEDGSLEQLLLSGMMPSMLVAGKMLAHWLTSALPLLLIAPLLGIMLGMDASSLRLLMLSLLLGTPSLTMIGVMSAALTIGLKKSGNVLALLLLPLTIPVLIFGTVMVTTAAGNQTSVSIMMLGALLLVLLPVTILASGSALNAAVSRAS